MEPAFFVGGLELLFSMVWRQGRSPNGYVMVFDCIETCMSFSFV